MNLDKVVPDTSVLIDGFLSKKISSGELSVREIIISEASVSELEFHANRGRETGFLGISEIQRLQELSEEKGFIIRFEGRRPTLEEIRLAKSGEIDALIRKLAREEGATLITSDRVQAEVAKAYGIPVIYIEKEKQIVSLTFEQWFEPDVTSLHLKENCNIKRKRGGPGNWYLEELPTILSPEEVQRIAFEILEAASQREDSFIEIERKGSAIVQLGNYRIVIVKPPVSDGWEITIVRPIKKLKLLDYSVNEKLLQRFKEKAEGILVAGRPGSGKSTFVQALAEWYNEQGRIVKTVESPRDLRVSDDITQYSKNYASSEEIHDILLLSRPDYVVFDEVRDTPDFKLYRDLRLAGVGMIGVVHAERPIDAVQRFISRVDLGMIPQVVDTVIFIEKGDISKVYYLQLVVKVPTGMSSDDLARPVVEVRDFHTDKIEYEIYTFGEEIVVVPVSKIEKRSSPLESLAVKTIEEDLKDMLRTSQVKVVPESGSRITVYVPSKYRPKLIGKRGKKIEKIEKKYGVSISVKDFSELKEEGNKLVTYEEVPYEIDIDGYNIYFYLDPKIAKKKVAIYVDGKMVTVATVNKKGVIRINRESDLGRLIESALNNGREVKIYKI